MLPGQLDLFGESTAPSTSIVGFQLRLSSPCHCGCNTVIVGSSKAMHHASIRCAQCGVHRGWLGRADFDHIIATINKSGRTSEPIEIGGKR